MGGGFFLFPRGRRNSGKGSAVCPSMLTWPGWRTLSSLNNPHIHYWATPPKAHHGSRSYIIQLVFWCSSTVSSGRWTTWAVTGSRQQVAANHHSAFDVTVRFWYQKEGLQIKAYPDIFCLILNEIQHLIRSELSGLKKKMTWQLLKCIVKVLK